jgi:hypothetical protein
MALREIGREVVDWIHVVEDREHFRALMNTVTKLRAPAGNFMTVLVTTEE